MTSIARRMRARRDAREFSRAIKSAPTPAMRNELHAIAARGLR